MCFIITFFRFRGSFCTICKWRHEVCISPFSILLYFPVLLSAEEEGIMIYVNVDVYINVVLCVRCAFAVLKSLGWSFLCWISIGHLTLLWPLLGLSWHAIFNTLRTRQNGCHFADDILKCIFLNENAWILIKISLKFVPKGPIDNIPALVQIMAWRRPGDKPLSEPMMVSLPTHIYITRPQSVKWSLCSYFEDQMPRDSNITDVTRNIAVYQDFFCLFWKKKTVNDSNEIRSVKYLVQFYGLLRCNLY